MGPLASALTCLSLSFSLCMMSLAVQPICGAVTELRTVVTTVLMNQQSLGTQGAMDRPLPGSCGASDLTRSCPKQDWHMGPDTILYLSTLNLEEN